MLCADTQLLAAGLQGLLWGEARAAWLQQPTTGHNWALHAKMLHSSCVRGWWKITWKKQPYRHQCYWRRMGRRCFRKDCLSSQSWGRSIREVGRGSEGLQLCTPPLVGAAHTQLTALVERQTGSTSPQRAGSQLVAALKASKVCLKQPERTDLPPAVVRERRSSFTIPFDLSYVCPQCFEALQLENMNQPCLCAYKVRFTLKDL